MNETQPTTIAQDLSKKTSLVEFFGPGDNFCGYCKRGDSEGRRSYDMKAYLLRAEDYQELLDKGWRRSGDYCYNPVNSNSCCPNYPISCKALDFKLTRSQRRCITNLNSFLIHGNLSNKDSPINYHPTISETKASLPLNQQEEQLNRFYEEALTSKKLRHRRFVKSCERKVKLYDISLTEAIKRTHERSKSRRSVCGGTLEDYLFPLTSSLRATERELKPKKELVIKLLPVNSKECKDLMVDEHNIITKYQAAVHNETAEEWSMSRFSDFLIKTPLVVEAMPHQDDLTSQTSGDKAGSSNKSQFLLVRPPNLPTCYGTYHCVYLLDGELIAVGVLDILTKCITTVYFFYNPQYKHLNLGIYSALVEISLVRQLAKFYSDIKKENKLIHYYLGFYVHECEKMHYKTRFKPSYLLCSETCMYIPTDKCLKKLVGRKYARFGPQTTYDNVTSKQVPSLGDILQIPVKAPCIQSDKMLEYFTWLERNLGYSSVDTLVNNILIQYFKLLSSPLAFKITLQVNAVHNALIQRHRRMNESRNLTTTSTTSRASTSRSHNDET